MRDIWWTILLAVLKDKAANGFFEIISIFRSVISFMRFDMDVVVKIGAGLLGEVDWELQLGSLMQTASK
jgi:hypothetical protein